MSLHEKSNWLVSYDISDARRGARVLRFIKKHGMPVQYSVFLVHASASEMHALMRSIEQLIARSVDDVRAYRVPVRTECHQLGRSILPDGVVLHAEVAPEPRRVEVATAPSAG